MTAFQAGHARRGIVFFIAAFLVLCELLQALHLHTHRHTRAAYRSVAEADEAPCSLCWSAQASFRTPANFVPELFRLPFLRLRPVEFCHYGAALQRSAETPRGPPTAAC